LRILTEGVPLGLLFKAKSADLLIPAFRRPCFSNTARSMPNAQTIAEEAARLAGEYIASRAGATGAVSASASSE